MIGFIFKRRFVNDVRFVLKTAFTSTSRGRNFGDGFALNKTAFLHVIDAWLKREEQALDQFSSAQAADIGMACHRARVWVGLFMAYGAYEQGAPHVSTQYLKRFYKPSEIVADDYFSRLRARSPQPFSTAFKETFESSLDQSMA